MILDASEGVERQVEDEKNTRMSPKEAPGIRPIHVNTESPKRDQRGRRPFEKKSLGTSIVGQ